MITRIELIELLKSTETFGIEKTISTTNTDKFCEAICAFSNDMPNSRQNGYLLIGVQDNGELNGLRVDDELMKKISSIRSDGNIQPIPSMTVDSFHFDKGDVLVVEVTPSSIPPVRYRGRTYIRIGPRKDIATVAEERILMERVAINFPTFDTTPCREASIGDIDLKLFESEYLPKAIKNDDRELDARSVKEKMAALRLYNLRYDCPTNAAIILFGKDPKYFLLGNYIQFVRYDGFDNAANIANEYEFTGNLLQVLPRLESFIEASIVQKRPVPISLFREKTVYNYPQWAIRELMMNAVMHRDYQTNTPTKLYQYSNRLEIVNAGGLFGNANKDNFPNVNDYRNPIVAEAMKILGYVNKYNRGIARVNHELEDNGNGKATFNVDKVTVFEAYVNDARAEDERRYGNSVSNPVSNSVSNSVSSDQILMIEDLFANSRINMDVVLSILSFVSQENPISSKEIFGQLGLSRGRISYINKLCDLGLLNRTNDSLKAPDQRYIITKLGCVYLSFKRGKAV